MKKINLLETGFTVDNSNRSTCIETFKNSLLSFGIDFKENVAHGELSYDFECNNTTLVEFDSTKDHNVVTGVQEVEFHKKSTECAESHGYHCIHVFDWDDPFKVALMLTPRKRVYARKCSVEEVDQRTANAFLKKYHLQGSARGQVKCYALYFNGSIVSVMTFGKPRYNRNYEWELIRLCYHPKYLVTGGSEKLWKQFVNEVDPKSVISYCDRSKFTGNVYYKLGMTLKSEGQPSKHWYSETEEKRSKHITNNFLLQRGYDQIFNEHYGKGTDNEELIMQRGYLPIYDCGQMTFEWRKEN